MILLEESMSQEKYILTLDIPKMMQAYENLGFQINPAMLSDLQNRLIDQIQKSVPCEVEFIDSAKVMKEVMKIVTSLKSLGHESVVVSPVPDITSLCSNGYCIHVNRIVNATGNFLRTGLELGARPGYGLLFDQIKELKDHLKGRPVILVDDGSFSGTTMRILIDILQDEEIVIDNVVVGIMFPKAKSFISSRVEEEKIFSFKDDSFLDWLPDHDFFPFMPNCGRVVGWDFNQQSAPVYLYNGLSLCQPYILPYGRPSDWASINTDKEKEFSIFCLTETIKIFEEMEGMNKRKIVMEDILRTYPRVSVPIYPRFGGEFPTLMKRIIDYLHCDLHDLQN
jgi:hypothetical protein